LSSFSYQSLFYEANKDGFTETNPNDKQQKKQPTEGVYHKFLQKYLEEAGVYAKSEESGNLGRADLVVRFLKYTYVIELKMAKDENGALEAAQMGLDQIREKNYGGRYKDPLLISLGLDKDKRNALACVFARGNNVGRLIVGQDDIITVAGHSTEA
jgi:hypothetical protein